MRRSLMVVILALAALATALVVPSSTADAQGTYDPAAEARRKGPVQEFAFGKVFHVSPFLPMDMDYAWRFRDPGERLTVHMQNLEASERRFDATLTLESRPMTAAAMAGVLARFPFMTMKVIALIHLQALRLLLKGARFHPHPRKTSADAPATSRNELTEVDVR